MTLLRLNSLKILKPVLLSSRPISASSASTMALAAVLILSQDHSALAQVTVPLQIAQSYSVRQPGANFNILYVNSITGNNRTGNGSEQLPFKTLTYALQVARPNTVILLASGVYSQETGEAFPLTMKPGVTIQGDPRLQGRTTLIYGGGFYQSPLHGDQNITMLAADGAGLTGVTLTNPFTNGYGLWIESASPVIIDNTFANSKKDGVAIAGNSAPVLRNNILAQNSGQGIALQSSVPATLRNSAATLNTREVPVATTGPVVMQIPAAPAYPVEPQDPVAATPISTIPSPIPTTPAPSSSPNPAAISISATSFPVPSQLSVAVQPQVTQPVVVQPIAPVATQPRPISPPTPAAVVQTRAQTLTGPNNRPLESKALPIVRVAPTASPRATQPVPIPTPAPTVIPVAMSQPAPRAALPATPIEIPVPPPMTSVVRPVRRTAPPPRPSNFKAYSAISNPRPVNPNSIAIVSPNIPAPPPSAKLTSPGLLPVPRSRIPVGNAGGRIVPPPPTALTVASGLKYRVLVEALDETQLAQLKALVPNAFTTVVRGRRVLQAGAFRERSKANELVQILASNGLRVTIDEL